MENKRTNTCPGCGRDELHKMCPAWGTEYYMSGKLFTKEIEKELKAEKELIYDSPDVAEIKHGRYERVITLPVCVTSNRAVSVYFTNGILQIKIDKLVEEENKFSVKLD